MSSTQVSTPSTSLSALFSLRERIESRRATVAVVGLGYVGLPLLVAAGAEGFAVIGLDVDPTKVRSLRRGESSVGDVSDDEISGLARAQFAIDPQVLVAADVIVITVPTPLRDGGPDLSMVRTAAEDVARVLRPGQLVVLESTTYPGTTEDLVQPILEASGLVAGFDFALAYSPERIEEVAREYQVAFQQDDQDTVPVLTADQDHLLLRRVEVENWTGLQLLQRIDRASRPGPWAGVVPPAPEELPLPVGPLLPAPPAASPAPTSTTVPRAAAAPVAGRGRTPAGTANQVLSNVTVPPVSVPPVNVTLPPVNVTLPPVTVPPLPVVTTIPPSTRPPATTTTRPPSPPTTQCKPAGKSGKCAGGG